MIICLDYRGEAYADCVVETKMRHMIKNEIDIFIANGIAFDCCRSIVRNIPVDQRPNIEWFAYGEEIVMNDHLKMMNLPDDDTFYLLEKFLFELI